MFGRIAPGVTAALLTAATFRFASAAPVVTTLTSPAFGIVKMPTAVARLGDNSLLIADGATGAIFRTSGDTTVRVVPAGTFRFPSAVLETRAHGVLVADDDGSCIERLEGTNVTPFAGRCGERGTSDGGAADARFNRPLDITEDPHGVLYVADLGNGVRRIDVNGNVHTVLASTGKDVTGVAWGHETAGDYLMVGKPSGLVICNANIGRCDLTFPADYNASVRSGLEGNRGTGFVYHLAPFSRFDALYTDPLNQSVRYYHFDQIFPVAGAVVDEPQAEAGGFSDGRGSQARFNAPLGIARDRDGSFLVADAGNGVIRRISNIVPILDTPAHTLDVADTFAVATGGMRIALIGDSGVWWNTGTEDSIGGQTASLLEPMSPKPLRVFSAPFPAADLDSVASYASDVLADSSAVGGVVLDIDPAMIEHFAPPPGDLDHASVWQEHFAAILSHLEQKLSTQKIRFAIIITPHSGEVSPAEVFAASFGGDRADMRRARAVYALLHTTVAQSGIPYYDALPDMIAAEGREGHRPLFPSSDPHPTEAGRALIACGTAQLVARAWLHLVPPARTCAAIP